MFLILQCFQVQLISACAQYDTTGFVVGGNNDQSFLRMFLVKFISYFDGVIHILHFVEYSSGVIGMAGPVYLSTFYHQEETFVLAFGEEVDSAFCDLSESQIIAFTVDSVRQARRVLAFFLYQDHFAGILAFCFIIVVATCYGVACFFENREDVGSVFPVVGLVRFQETTACIKVKVCFGQVNGDFIIHITVCLMSIESGGSGMVYADGSSDAYFLSGLLRFFGYRFNRVLVFSYGDGAVVGLLAGCQCSTCGCRVSYRVGGRESGCHGSYGELSEQQRFNADTSVLAFCLIHFRTVYLVDSHSIADEIEYILCLTVGCNGYEDKK